MIIYLEERPTADGGGVGDGEDAKLIERVLHRESERGREGAGGGERSKEEERVGLIRSGRCGACIMFTVLKRRNEENGAGRRCVSCSHSAPAM